MLCVLCDSPDCSIYITDTKPTCCPCLQSPQKLKKNDSGTDPRTPLAYASCFPAQLPCIAQQVVVAMDRCFSATVPTAPGLCQTLSVSLTVCRLHSSTAMLGKEKHSPSAVHDNIIVQQMDTEIGTHLWTQGKAQPQSAGALYGS